LYVSAIPDWLTLVLTFTTLMISVPVGLLVIGLLGTLYKGSIEYKTPMLYAAGFLFLFLIGGLTGIPNAMSSIYVHIHGTYWIPGHFHYVMAVSASTGVIGGTYYVFPKLTGKMYNEALGKLGFILFFIGANITFFLTMYIGVEYGMPRRYYDYQQFPQIEGLQRITTYGSYIILLGAIVILISWVHGLIAGKKAPLNPWGSKSLEWTHTQSPPPPGNFTQEPKLSEDWDPYNYRK
jgi:cytochrome c oxidase subunit 1